QQLYHVALVRGAVDDVVAVLRGMEHRETVVVLCGEHDELHARGLGQRHDGIGIELLRIEALGQYLVLGYGHRREGLDLLAVTLRDALAVPYAAQLRVQAEVDKQAKLARLPGLHSGDVRPWLAPRQRLVADGGGKQGRRKQARQRRCQCRSHDGFHRPLLFCASVASDRAVRSYDEVSLSLLGRGPGRGVGIRDSLSVPHFGSPAAGFRSPAGARVTSLCWPKPPQERWRTAQPARRAEGGMPGVKRSNPEKRPGSIRRNYKQEMSRLFGTIPAYAIDGTATPRHIWTLRRQFLRRVALAVASSRLERAAFPGPLCGGEAWTTRPRSGHRQGGRCLFARAGARSKSPAAPHGLEGQDARRAPHRGGLLFGLLFSWPRKRKVTRAPAGARNRFETCESAKTQAPLPPPFSRKR